MSTVDRKYKYSEICRGRYLCELHGGFCDGADNYLSECPICKRESEPSTEVVWTVNSLDRTLHLVNGLQKRSARNASIVSALLAGVGALVALPRVLESLTSQTTAGLDAMVAYSLFQIGLAFLVVALGCYSASMVHIRIIRTGEMPSKTMDEWERHVVGELSFLEKLHWWGGFAFLSAALAVIGSLLWPVIEKFCS